MEYFHHCIFRGGDHPLLFHVRVVYQPCTYKSDESNLYLMPVCHDRAVSDGNVYIVKDRKHAPYGESLGDHHHLSGVRRGTFGIHVHRVHEIHSTGNRGSGDDRRMYTAPDILPCGYADRETHLHHGCDSAGYVDLERLSSAVPCAGSEKI